jgi:hypothetical protein
VSLHRANRRRSPLEIDGGRIELEARGFAPTLRKSGFELLKTEAKIPQLAVQAMKAILHLSRQ